MTRQDDPFGSVWVCCRTVFLSTRPLLLVPPCISSGVTVSNRGIRWIHKLVLWVCLCSAVQLFIRKSLLLNSVLPGLYALTGFISSLSPSVCPPGRPLSPPSLPPASVGAHPLSTPPTVKSGPPLSLQVSC